jgi:hypothetical protein
MFLLISVLVVLSVAATIYFFQRRQPPSLIEKKTSYFPDETDLRPLFALDQAEIDRAIRQEKAMAANAEAASAKAELDAELEAARRAWLADPGRKTTAQLIKLATETKRADTFAETANEIVRVHRERRISGLTDNDVAALLDSHYLLLPVNERSSGAIFWIKEEIAKLRASLKDKAG